MRDVAIPAATFAWAATHRSQLHAASGKVLLAFCYTLPTARASIGWGKLHLEFDLGVSAADFYGNNNPRLPGYIHSRFRPNNTAEDLNRETGVHVFSVFPIAL